MQQIEAYVYLFGDFSRLEQLLFPPPPALPAQDQSIPNWLRIHQELKHKGVTLFLLWQEYRETHHHGYQYSWFCGRHRQFFSLAEHSVTISTLLIKLNDRAFRKLPGCCREHFEQMDLPALQPLPTT